MRRRDEMHKVFGRSPYYCPACQPEECKEASVAKKEEWEKLRKRSAERFGEDSIFGEGSLDAKLALVGEAPGKQEVEQGRPFVGRAGKLLDELLKGAGIDRSKAPCTVDEPYGIMGG
jgi:uracil-DNA glycosylase